MNREVELTIRLYERAYENVEDLLDALCAKVEIALNNDTTIGANSILLNATGIDIDDGDQQIGVASMIYTIQFFSIQDPEQII